MARTERRALGRGLGSLIPDRDENVSRETISEERGSERPTDIFFTGPSGADSRERRSSSISADLMKPMPRGSRDAKKKEGSKAPARSAGGNGSTAGTSRPKKAASSATSKSGGSKAAPQKADSEKLDSTKIASQEESGKAKRELFADIIDPEPSDSIEGSKGTDAGNDLLDEVTGGAQRDETEQSGEGGTGAESDDQGIDAEIDLVPVPGATFAEIDVELVVPNPKQPREVFDESELEELAASIREIGVLQPIVVRPVDGSDEKYAEIVEARSSEGIEELPEFELIMGERRLRATKLAGLDLIPAIVRDTEDVHLLRDALLENLHRTQLNPIEEANAYQQLMSDFGYTQQELSERIARSRPQIANSLRLLKLPPTVQRKLAAGVISASHARALLGLPNAMQMEALAERIIAEGLSVRTTEEIVSLGDVTEKVASKKAAKRIPQAPSEHASVVINRLTDLLDTRVTVQEGKKKGRITIEYAGIDDLDRISQVIANLKGPTI